MKRLILASVSALCIVFSASANDNVTSSKDTAQLKQRIENLEKQVASLDSQMKVLHSKLSQQQAVTTPKKMVIDRRGSKQVRFE